MNKVHFALWFNPDAFEEDKDLDFVPICNPTRYYKGNNYVGMYDHNQVDCKRCERTFNDPETFEEACRKYDEMMK